MSKDKERNSTRRRWRRLLKWLIAAGIITALVILALKPKAVEVDAATIVRGAMRLTVDEDGKTSVRQRYRIFAPLAGKLSRITLESGDAVKQGEVLAILDPETPTLLDPRARAQGEAAVRAAEAAVASALTQLEARSVEAAQRKKAFERTKTLNERGNLSDAEFEQSESAYLAAKHAREAAASAAEIARYELEQAKAALRRFDDVDETPTPDSETPDSPGFSIRAPIDGVVLGIENKSARLVQSGAPLLEIGDPDALEMRIDVLSQEAVSIKPGQRVIVEHWGGANPLEGRVRRIEPSAYTKVSALGVDEQRVDVIADFTAPLPDGATLADGYRIEARIVIWETDDAVQVPAGALFREGDQWAVYKIDGDRARLKRIEVGRNNGEVAEVLAGLEAGDRVLLHPGDRIAENTLVAPRK